MTTGTQEWVELAHLDFDPPCRFVETGPHGAGWAVICRCCGDTGFFCRPHLDAWKAPLVAWLRRGGVIECMACGDEAETFEQACKVVAL